MGGSQKTVPSVGRTVAARQGDGPQPGKADQEHPRAHATVETAGRRLDR